ncbi:hypothetical protein ABZW03_29035, partial [Kitasatospora sp. NPDC004799]
FVNFRRAKRAAATAAAQPAPQPGAALLPYLSFGSVLFALLVPVAAALYLLTTSAWSAAERAWLYRDGTPVPAAALTV